MTRHFSIALVTMLIAAIAALIAGALSVTGRLPDSSSPLTYSAPVYNSGISSICPGDTLTFVVTSTVSRAPTRVSTYLSIWDANARRTIQSDSLPTNNLIFLSQDIGRTVSSTVVFSETAALAPGRYEYRRFAQALGREPATFYVPFTVMDCQ